MSNQVIPLSLILIQMHILKIRSSERSIPSSKMMGILKLLHHQYDGHKARELTNEASLSGSMKLIRGMKLVSWSRMSCVLILSFVFMTKKVLMMWQRRTMKMRWPRTLKMKNKMIRPNYNKVGSLLFTCLRMYFARIGKCSLFADCFVLFKAPA